MTPPSPFPLPCPDGASGRRARLAGHRLRLRRQRRGAAAGREGPPRGACSSAAAGSPTTSCRARPGTCGATSGRRSSACKGIFRLTIFRDVAIVSGSGVGGGSLGYANTLYRAPERFYADPQWAGLEDWSGALAPHFDTAERMLGVVTVDADDPADVLLREYGEEIGADRTYAKTRVGVYFGTPGETVDGPVLRRRRPGAHRLHPVRALHGRLPVQRQEHAAEELPVARRAGRRDDRAGAHGRRHPAARRARRLRRLRGDERAHRRLAATATAASTPRAASSSRPARSAPTGCSRAPSCAARCRASPTASGELVRTNSEAILAVTLPPGSAGHDQARGDLLERLPRPRHAHRDGHLRRGGRQHERALHAAGRRRHAR